MSRYLTRDESTVEGRNPYYTYFPEGVVPYKTVSAVGQTIWVADVGVDQSAISEKSPIKGVSIMPGGFRIIES